MPAGPVPVVDALATTFGGGTAISADDWKARAEFRALCRRSLYFFTKSVVCAMQDPNLMTARTFKESCEWLQAVVERHKRGLFEDSRDHAKCLSPDAPVAMHDGSWRKAGELRVGDLLAGRNAVTDVWRNPPQRCVEVSAGGIRARTSRNHPFKTQRGWVNAEDLTADDHVQLLRRHLAEPHGALTVAQAALLGYLVGDGSTTACISFTNGDRDVVDDFERVAEAAGYTCSERAQDNHWLVILSGAQPFVRRHGIKCKSEAKRIPRDVFRSSLPAASAFLRAYFDCDGTVGKSNGITLTSCHRALVEDTARLLLRFGIHCRIYDQGPRAYMLDVSHHDLFLRHVGFTSARKAARAAASRRDTGHADIVPNALVGERLPFGKRGQFLKNRGVSISSKYPTITSTKVDRIAACTGIDMDDLTGVFWRRVDWVRDSADRETIDVTTATHEIPVNGFITHNSYRSTIAVPLWVAVQLPHETAWDADGLGQPLDLPGEIARANEYLIAHPHIKGPDNRFVVACEAMPRAKSWVGASMRHWRMNEMLRWAFPELLWPNFNSPGYGRWSEEEYYLPGRKDPTKPGGFMRAISVQSSEVGSRADFIILDDLLSESTQDSPAELAYRCTWFRSITQLLDKRSLDDPGGGVVLMVSNRKNLNDPNSLVHDEMPHWQVWHRGASRCVVHDFGNCGRQPSDTPTECAPTGQPVWPEKHPDLEIVRADVGDDTYFTEWENNPRKKGDLDDKNVISCDLRVQPDERGQRGLYLHIPEQRSRESGEVLADVESMPLLALRGHVISIDPAGADEESVARAQGKTARWAASWTAYDPPTGRVVCLDERTGHWTPDEAPERCFELWREAEQQLQDRVKILCEKVAVQTMVKTAIKQCCQLHGVTPPEIVMCPRKRGLEKTVMLRRTVGYLIGGRKLLLRTGHMYPRVEIRHFPTGTLDWLDTIAQAYVWYQENIVGAGRGTQRMQRRKQRRRYALASAGATGI